MYIISQAPAAAILTVASGAAQSPFLVAAGEPGAGTQLNLNVPGSNRLNGQPFTVRAAGFMTCGAGTYTSAATPIQFVFWGSNTASFAAATGNALFSTTALAIFSVSSATAVSVPWEIEMEISGDGTSGTLVGVGQGIYGSSVNLVTSNAQARAALGQLPTVHTVNMATEPPLQVAVGVITASSNLLNVGSTTVTLTQFQLEA
jgi:hypothetical protein